MGENTAGTMVAGAAVGFWSKKLGGPSTTGRFISGLWWTLGGCDVDSDAGGVLLLSGRDFCGGEGELPLEPSGVADELLSDGTAVVAPSAPTTSRLAFLEALRVGLRVHLRFLPAHRLHGNFLSHLVFVLAQLLQAMGVRPADFGMMPWFGGKPSWLFWSRPWTV